MIIEKGKISDIDELESLYNNLNDHLESNINYPGWIKHIYPTRETAVEGIAEDNLFVLKIKNIIAGSIILNHKPENAYNDVKWGISAEDKDVIVIHSLVVHPSFLKMGVASALMEYAKQYSIEKGMKAIRLDVSVNNSPAITLYEKRGYKYIETVDLGLNYQHLIWFRLYELIL